jgi:hypothetical protein
MIDKWKTTCLIFLSIMMTGCSNNFYTSHKATPDYRIDGVLSEWSGKFQIPEDQNFAISVSNDKNYVYVAISSRDKVFQREIILRGLTLWLDARGRKHRDLGIKFEGSLSGRKRPGTYQREQYKVGGQLGRDGSFDHQPMLDGDLSLIVINTRTGKRMGPADLLASASFENETLFVEYQIPMAILGADFDINKKLGLGIVSSSEKPAMGAGQPGGMRSTPGGGGKGGRSGGMAGGQRGKGGTAGPGKRQNDLDVWLKIQLKS